MGEADTLAVVAAVIEASARRENTAVLVQLSPDFIEEFPQSGERISGAANAVAATLADPSAPILMTPSLTRCGEALVLVEARAMLAAERPWIVSLYELGGPLVRRRTTYVAAPFDAPAWRARWVEAIPAVTAQQAEEAATEVDRSLVERYTQALAANDLTRLGEMRHANWVVDLPQSGERFRGHASVVAADQNYPGGLPSGQEARLRGAEDRWALSPSYVPLRIEGRGIHWVSESQLTYATGERVHGVALLTFRDRKAIAERWYYCAALMPTAWRRRWTEG
jgi:hypothetical protein